jgi:hypothetical protein
MQHKLHTRRGRWFALAWKLFNPLIPFCSFILLAFAASPPQIRTSIEGRVLGASGRPLGRVKVSLIDADGMQTTATTGRNGTFHCVVVPGDYRISLQRSGYLPIRDRQFLLRAPRTHLQITLQLSSGPKGFQKFVGVIAPRSWIVSSQHRPPSNVSVEVRENLPEISETMLDRYGDIRTAGAQSVASRYLVDSPGQSHPQDFGLMNNLSEATISTPETQSESSYRFGGTPIYDAPGGPGLTQVTMPLPGWKAHFSNPFPGIRYQRGFRLGDWAPRLSFSGPVHGSSLWFNDSVSGEHAIVIVPELPRNEDSINAWAGSNLATLQAIINPHHSLSWSFLASRRVDSHVGLSPYNPLQSTVSLGANRVQLGATDQYSVNRLIFETGLRVENLDSALSPQGGTPYILHPGSAAGSYFETLRGHSQKGNLFANVLIPWDSAVGSQQFQIGGEGTATNFDHLAQRQPFQILDENGNPVQITNFIGNSQFSLSNTRWSEYLQDTWKPWSRLRLEGGLRVDWDRLITFSELSPRVSAALLPFANRKTKIFGLWGAYYPELNLALLGQAEDQLRVDQFYGSGPPIVSDFTASLPTLRGPHYTSERLGVEQEIGRANFVGVSVLSRHQRDGLAYQKLAARRGLSLLPLLNDRRDDYKAVEITIKHVFSRSAEVVGSYTRSHSRTNQALDYNLDSQAFDTQLQGPLNYDAPDRVVSWGWSPVVARTFIASYLLEYRTGFPFSVFDENYQLVGLPNSYRFPHMFRLNLGFEKLIGVAGRRIGVRFAVLNVTNHGNYTAVDNNIASTSFLQYGASVSRSYTVRVRLVPGD